MRIALLLTLMLAAGCRVLDDVRETALHLATTTVLESVFSLQSANPQPQSSFKASMVVPPMAKAVSIARVVRISNQQVHINAIITACTRARHTAIDQSVRTRLAQLSSARCKLSAAKRHEEIIVIDRL